jgi:hypothetical protein
MPTGFRPSATIVTVIRGCGEFSVSKSSIARVSGVMVLDFGHQLVYHSSYQIGACGGAVTHRELNDLTVIGRSAKPRPRPALGRRRAAHR